MSEIIDKMAAAICHEHGWYRWDNPDFAADAERRGNLGPDDYRRIARAAIEVLREPTDAMVSAFGGEFWNDTGYGMDKSGVARYLTLMIDEALR
jgi:hypothetical protein